MVVVTLLKWRLRFPSIATPDMQIEFGTMWCSWIEQKSGIAKGETKTFAVLPGEYELRLKIDSCGSNAMKVQLNAGQQLRLFFAARIRAVVQLVLCNHRTDKYLWLEADET